MTAPDPDAVLDLWEVRSRGPYTVAFDWCGDPLSPVAGYLTLASPRHGHRLEAAVSWEQLHRFHQSAAQHLAERSASADTGELPRMPRQPTS